ncbi:hypothetical protein SPFM8_00067 [Salmonella phage SPFM8]|nr:hypothetical protein SPFM8_00067 [Salmonella phage SPFM8]
MTNFVKYLEMKVLAICRRELLYLGEKYGWSDIVDQPIIDKITKLYREAETYVAVVINGQTSNVTDTVTSEAFDKVGESLAGLHQENLGLNYPHRFELVEGTDQITDLFDTGDMVNQLIERMFTRLRNMAVHENRLSDEMGSGVDVAIWLDEILLGLKRDVEFELHDAFFKEH